MNFKKFMSAGLAAATGLTMAVATVEAGEVVYEDNSSIPNLRVTIDDSLSDAYTITLSTVLGTGIGDWLGLGFNYFYNIPYGSGADPLTLADISYVEAWKPTGSDDPANKFNDTDPVNPGDPENELEALYNDSELFVAPNSDGISTCGQGCNFNGLKDENGDQVKFDYILNIGDQGSNAGSFVDEIKLTIASPVTPNLDTESSAFFNPFTNFVAGRLQTTTTSGSLKSLMFICTDDIDCDNIGQRPPVPEIDGPVLIQVGFALGGLYLLLLGRRREEDELAHAA